MVKGLFVRLVFILFALFVVHIYISYSANTLWLPTCTIKENFGVDCPGCGGQRAFGAILNGKFVEAYYHNQLIYFYLFVILMLAIGIIESYILKTAWFVRNFKVPVWFAYFFIVTILLFTVWRNL